MQNRKAEKMVRVSEFTLKIIHQHGLEGLTHSPLARAAGVSRPWLYAYVGKTKEALIQLAVKHFGQVYAQVDNPPRCQDERNWIDHQISGLRNSLKQVVDYPWIMPIYFRYRCTETTLGKFIVDAEKLYLKREVAELQNALKINATDARVVAELDTAFKLGLQHRWAVTSLSKDVDPEFVLKLGRIWLRKAIRG